MHAIEYAVNFARCASNTGADPYELARLVKAIRKAANAGQRECNEGTAEAAAKADKARTLISLIAAKTFRATIKVSWYGLFPTILVDGQEVHVPLP